MILEYAGVEKELSAERIPPQQPHGAHGGHRGPEALKSPAASFCTATPSIWSTASARDGRAGRENGWKRADKKPALNADLWERFFRPLSATRWSWSGTGHDGHPQNERCDRLAAGFAKSLKSAREQTPDLTVRPKSKATDCMICQQNTLIYPRAMYILI